MGIDNGEQTHVTGWPQLTDTIFIGWMMSVAEPSEATMNNYGGKGEMTQN